MNEPELRRFEVEDETHGAVPCALLRPSANAPSLPLCVFLYGGGGSRDTLAGIQPLLARAWASGELPAMAVATPDVGPWSFYLDDPQRGLRWESFVFERFIPRVREQFELAANTALVGISMGGFGALAIALAHPNDFAAVAAVSPMIEPALEADEVRPRNRYHYPPGLPEALLGRDRDRALYRRSHPAARARAHADALRASELAIYVDAAGADVLHAHDGAEFLHRVLWDLDVAHEYRLRRDSDHVGADLEGRLFDAFSWVSARLGGSTAPLTDEQRALRAYLEPLRRDAAMHDPTMSRRYGVF